MSVILVVEQDTAYANRIASVLRTAGRQAEIAGDVEAAEQLAVRPDLVLVSGTLPNAPGLLGQFSTNRGGPGSVVALPISLAGQVAPSQYQADRVLPKPFSDEELLSIVGQLLPSPAELAQGQLTSADIFGDVLAEVEAEAQAVDARRRRTRSDNSDIDRKLEETLSGFFPDKLREAAPPPQQPAKPKRRRDVPSADEIEDLLDKTLSSLELPARARKAKAPPAPVPTEPALPQEPSRSGFASPQPKVVPAPRSESQDASTPPPGSFDDLRATAEAAIEDPSPPPAPFTPTPEPVDPPAPQPTASSGPISWETGSFAKPDVGGFSLQEEAPSNLPEPEYPTSFASAEEVEEAETEAAVFSSFVADKAPGDQASFAEISANEAAAPPTSEPTASFEPLPSFDSPPTFEPAPSVEKSSQFFIPGAEASADVDSATIPSLGRASQDSDPFAESRHGIHATDFESAFAMPKREEAEAPGEDSTDQLQQALDGVLSIRGEEAPSSQAQEGVPFGDYRLLERIAVGGMAEVWKARRRGVEGFQKTVAIKKILSHLTGSSDFVTMFIDEAKLAAQLTHANIVQIYDLGKVGDDFFIAMELIDGKDLRSILNRAADLGRPIPAGLALNVVAALARALDYAHRKRDFENRAMGLVHRDVSPQNVLISYEGEIKLCDFGIVKAVAKASTTQMGALKGKLQYMSPEQAWGKEVDARSDIFSLGSVLFEVLTGRRLFTGDSEIGVLDAVRDCRVQAPGELIPGLSPEVDRITLKALAQTPAERYQTAGELERDIQAVLESLKPGPGQADLAAYLESLFRSPAVPITAGVGTEPISPPPEISSQAAPSTAPAEAPQTHPNAEPAAVTSEPSKTTAKTLLIAAIVLAALATIAFIAYRAFGPQEAPPAPVGTPVQVHPSVPLRGVSTESKPVDMVAIDIEGMMEDALANAREQLEAEFEAEQRRIQEKLNKMQSDSGPGDP